MLYGEGMQDRQSRYIHCGWQGWQNPQSVWNYIKDVIVHIKLENHESSSMHIHVRIKYISIYLFCILTDRPTNKILIS